MRVPLLELTTQNGALADEMRAAFDRVLTSGQYIMGPELERFEQSCAEFCQTKHALGVSSGTDALILALMALNIGPGDEVIVPSFTFFATAGCVSRVGATPVFCDCCESCFNIQRSDVEPLITERTKAVIAVHLFGQCAPMDELLALAEERRIDIIEDAAQAFGAKDRDRPAGSMGSIGTFSFFPSKNLGGLGDSGLVTTNDDALAERMRILRVHGGQPKYYHHFIGGNFRMDPLQAALLSAKLPHYGEYTARRRANAKRYRAALGTIEGVASACDDCGSEPTADAATPRLILPEECEGQFHTWNQFTIRLPGEGRRDALRAFLAEREIGSETYYPLPLHKQACFAGLGCSKRAFPVTEKLAQEVLSIPVYPELSEAQVDLVAETIRAFLDVEHA